MYVVELIIGVLLIVFGLAVALYIVYSSLNESHQIPVLHLSEAVATVAIGVFYIVCAILISNMQPPPDLEPSGSNPYPVNLTFMENEGALIKHPENLFDTNNFYGVDRPGEVLEDVKTENSSEVVDKFLLNYQKFFNDIIYKRVRNDSIKNFYYNNKLYDAKTQRSLKIEEVECDYEEVYLKYVMLVVSFVYGLMSVINSALECKTKKGGDGEIIVGDGRVTRGDSDAESIGASGNDATRIFDRSTNLHPDVGGDNNVFTKRKGKENEPIFGRNSAEADNEGRLFIKRAEPENDRTILVKSNVPRAIIEPRKYGNSTESTGVTEQNVFGSQNILDSDSTSRNPQEACDVAPKKVNGRQHTKSSTTEITENASEINITRAFGNQNVQEITNLSSLANVGVTERSRNEASTAATHSNYSRYRNISPITGHKNVQMQLSNNENLTPTVNNYSKIKKTLQLLFTWLIPILYTILVYFTMQIEAPLPFEPPKPYEIKPQATDMINLIEKPINVSSPEGMKVNDIIDKIYKIVASAQSNETKTPERQSYPSVMFDIIKYFNNRRQRELEGGCEYKNMPIKLHTLLVFVVAYAVVLFYTKNVHTKLEALDKDCETKRLGRRIGAFAALWLPSVFEVFTRAYLMNYKPNLLSDVCLAVGNVSRFVVNGMNVKAVKDEIGKRNDVIPVV